MTKPVSISCHNFDPLLISLGLFTLEQRRFTADAIFVYKIVNHYTDCPEILQFVKLTAPSRSFRRFPIFHISLCKTNYASSIYINRICEHANLFAHRLDFFRESFSAFKKNARNAIRNTCAPFIISRPVIISNFNYLFILYYCILLVRKSTTFI